MDYAAVAVDAVALITEFGQDVPVARAGVSLTTVKGVQTKRTRKDIVVAGIPNVSYAAGDERQLILAAGTYTPKAGDVLTVQGVDVLIIELEELNPGGTSLLWKVVAT